MGEKKEVVDFHVDECDEEGGKENQTEARTRRGRTKKQQFDMIADFYKFNNEKLLDNKKYNELWDNLTRQLNCIGPPTYSSIEWKRVWSEHKYNKKRKRSDVAEDQPSNIQPLGEVQNLINNDDSNQRMIGVPAEFSESLQGVLTYDENSISHDEPSHSQHSVDVQQNNNIFSFGVPADFNESLQSVLAYDQNSISHDQPFHSQHSVDVQESNILIFDQPQSNPIAEGHNHSQFGVDFQTEILDRLGEIVKRQDVIIQLIQQLVESNQLMMKREVEKIVN